MKTWHPGLDGVAAASVKFTSELAGRNGKHQFTGVFCEQLGIPKSLTALNHLISLKVKTCGYQTGPPLQGKRLDFDAAAACCGLGTSA